MIVVNEIMICLHKYVFVHTIIIFAYTIAIVVYQIMIFIYKDNLYLFHWELIMLVHIVQIVYKIFINQLMYNLDVNCE